MAVASKLAAEISLTSLVFRISRPANEDLPYVPVITMVIMQLSFYFFSTISYKVLALLKVLYNFATQSTFKMNKERDYISDIAEIRSMMDRSSKFLSLSGWAGILAGIYALVGAYIAYGFFRFNPTEIVYNAFGTASSGLLNIISLAASILVLSISTAVFLSYRRAKKTGEKLWNATSRRLLANMSIPLVSGGVLLLVFIFHGLDGLLAPLTLLFYGLALYSAGNFTYKEVRFLGVIQIGLGLISSCFIEYGLLFWALGFGLMHIVYGIYIHLKYER